MEEGFFESTLFYCFHEKTAINSIKNGFYKMAIHSFKKRGFITEKKPYYMRLKAVPI